MGKKVRKLLHGKRLPNLRQYQSIDEYILGQRQGGHSDSETEVEENTEDNPHVVLPQPYVGEGNVKSQKTALKLMELGPRLQLKLCKVEKGLGKGEVLYHAFVNKTDQEKEQKRKELEEMYTLKKQRREKQEENVRRKKCLKLKQRTSSEDKEY